MDDKLRLLHKNLIPAYAYFILTVLAYLSGRFHTYFSYGEFSQSISSLWIFLLLFGAVFNTLTAVVFTLLKRQPSRFALAVYSSGVVAYTAGLSVRGFFEIFGHDKSLIRFYEFAGIGLMIIGILLIVAYKQRPSAVMNKKWSRAIRVLVQNGNITSEEADAMAAYYGDI